MAPDPAEATRPELPFPARVLLVVTAALVVFGQVMVYSASSAMAMTSDRYGHDSLYFVKTGALYLAGGVVALLVVMRMPTSWLRRLAPVILLASFVGLVAATTIGPVINGAQRWIYIGPVSVQPSEFAKLGLLGTVAIALAARRRPPSTIKELFLPVGLLTGLACALIVESPDLGTALALLMMIASMVLVAGTPARLLARVTVVGLGLVGLAIALSPYRRDRFLAFLDPWAPHQAADGSYQVVQALIGIGSGGVFGNGLGNGVQKVNYLPEAHTDMIFAVIGEELGLVGALLVVALFGTFAWAGYSIALASRDRFRGLVAIGATSLVVGQAIVNLGAVMGMLPLTGIPLPLISYGSSSRLVTLVMVGLLLAIAREDAHAAAADEEEDVEDAEVHRLAEAAARRRREREGRRASVARAR